MNKLQELPTQEYLQECFDYNPKTGELIWKARPLSHFEDIRAWRIFNTRFSKKQAGNIGRGKKTVHISKKAFSLPRLVFKLMLNVDVGRNYRYINKNRLDTRLENLSPSKEVPKKEPIIHNSTGFKGVWILSNGKYAARACKNKKRIYLGVFNTVEEANKAYLNALEKMC